MARRIERFTPRAKTVLSLAEIETRYYRQRSIQAPHVLLGLYDEKEGIAGQVLRQLSFNRDYIVEEVKKYVSDTPQRIELGPETKRILERTVDEARRFGLAYIGTGQLLIATIGQVNATHQNILDRGHVSHRDIIEFTRQQLAESNDPHEHPRLSLHRLSKQNINKNGLWYRLTKTFQSILGITSNDETDYVPDPDDEVLELEYLATKVNIASELMQSQPDNVYLYPFRGAAYLLKKDYVAAAADYQETIRRGHRIASVYENLGAALMGQRDYSGAVSAYTELIEKRPEEFAAYVQRAEALLANGEFEKALTDLAKAEQLQPEQAVINIARGEAYLENNEYQQAIKECNEALRLNPDAASAYHLRGSARAHRKDYTDAQTDFDTMARLCPRSATVHSNFAWLHFLRGEYEPTITEAKIAIDIDPKIAMAYYVRGSAFRAIGNTEEAINDYRLAKSYWPYPNTKRGISFIQEMQE